MSESPAPVDLVLLWHHHQPDYRRPSDGRSVLPWTRLHATKDYLDMARRLERHPGVRVTFNLVPSLLDQIEGAANGEPDLLFELLARPIATLGPEERTLVAGRAAQVPPHALERWPELKALLAGAAAGGPAPGSGGPGPADAWLLALETWFLLAWLDPMFHAEPEAARALGERPRWSERHRDDLLALHQRLTAEVIPAYRALAERGQVELSTSPYHHPILPLLIDLASARRARPHLPLPATLLAGAEDARWHIERALDRHAAAFGARTAGMWPSEGSVSPETVALAARAGMRWLASDEGVLFASLGEGARERAALYRPWRVATGHGEVTLFFRDHALSDRIGFVYQRWEPQAAAADFVAQLRRIGREHAGAVPPVVSVILDGENCWEHYREDGGPFLDALYGTLAAASDIRMRTPSEILAEGRETAVLPRLHSGSWIDADFHIWIGHPEKNRAWDLLARTRQALVDSGATAERSPLAWQALHRAEGSDWFWWFGDDHPTRDRAVFDRLYRELLSTACTAAGLEAPAALRLPIARGAVDRDAAPIGFVTPTIDGRRTSFYEWHEAGRREVGHGGSMHRDAGLVHTLHWGFDAERFHLRLDFTAAAPPGEDYDLKVEMVEPRPAYLRVAGLVPGRRVVVGASAGGTERELAGAECRIDTLLELSLPFASARLTPGQPVALLVQALREGRPVESYPDEAGLAFTVPGPDFEAEMWSA